MSQLAQLATEASLTTDTIDKIQALHPLGWALVNPPLGHLTIGPPSRRRKLALLRLPAIPADVGPRSMTVQGLFTSSRPGFIIGLCQLMNETRG